MPNLKRSTGPDLHYVIDDFTDPWKNAPYLILQHGNGRSGEFWYSWIPYLSRFYKVVRPDVRGLGQSAADFDLASEFTLEHCVADVLAILDELGAASAHFCGESMGGMIGMAFAATHAARVRTLTLVSTPISINEKGKVTFADKQSKEERERGVDEWLAASNRGMRFPPDTDPGLVEWYNAEFKKGRREVQAAMGGLANRANVAAYLANIKLPVLGLYPTNGPLTTPDQEAMLISNIKDLRLVHMPTSYHKVQMVFPAGCATQLLHFISAHDGRPCRES
ncbi:MAG: alpha/beta-hydrolase [Betaproteobacteria bacterium]|nr:alpha/beta-hydrolase [Betaproteobacteria bacterium]